MLMGATLPARGAGAGLAAGWPPAEGSPAGGLRAAGPPMLRLPAGGLPSLLQGRGDTTPQRFLQQENFFRFFFMKMNSSCKIFSVLR